ncbi:MAG: ABC transporter permease subunit [Clostridia bacterium]|nr:ABC transporter permease subunit [Clostridia bacterium]
MLAIWKREFQNYFLTPIGYVFTGMFLLLGGYFFTRYNLMSSSAYVSTVLGNLNTAFMLIVPILTMRLLSEEKRNRSDQLLITSPRSIWDIVLGKYFAACSVVLIATVLSLVYVVILATYSEAISFLPVLCNYLGFVLLSMCYVAIGVLMSSITESQVVAAVLTLGINLLLQLIDSTSSMWTLPSYLSFINVIVSWFSLYTRYSDFSAGILSIANVFYYLSFSGIMLFLAVRVIDRRRWSEG